MILSCHETPDIRENASKETSVKKPSDQVIKEFINLNLHSCCYEILEWRKTGILSDGKVREIAEQTDQDIPGTDHLRIVEDAIHKAAMEFVFKNV